MILTRALFLACSWCWCLGMFFPVYLCLDFGWPRWLAFVVPNIIGAAGMGLMLTRRGASERIVAEHGAVMRAFNVITILFHVSFLCRFFAYAASVLPPHQGYLGGLVVGVLLLVAAAMSRMRSRGWAVASVVVYAASAVSAVAAWRTGNSLQLPPLEGERPLTDLIEALPVLALGFLLCPFLDLTFHRVRRELPGRAGSAAFLLGFGVLFLLLMVYSLLYAGGFTARLWSTYLLLHLAAQCVFTIGAHLRELFGGLGDPRIHGTRRAAGLVVLVIVACASVALPWMEPYRPGYSAARLVYELFMSFYGLLFPAYVWIVMVPRGIPRRAAVIAWAAAVTIAAPMMWLGYIEQRYAWLLTAVASVLVSPVIVRVMVNHAGKRARTP